MAAPKKYNHTHSREHMDMMRDKRSRDVRERKIAELIAKAPPLLPEQRARLAALLDQHPEVA